MIYEVIILKNALYVRIKLNDEIQLESSWDNQYEMELWNLWTGNQLNKMLIGILIRLT